MQHYFAGDRNRRMLGSGTVPGVQPFAVALAVLLAAAPSQGAPQAGPKRLPTPNGRAVYRMTTTGQNAMTGTLKMTWAEYGRRMRQDTQMRVQGSPQMKAMSMNTWSVIDGRTVTTGMPGPGRRAMRMKLPANLDSTMLLGGVGGISGSGPGKVIGRATILGKPCVIRSVTLNTAYMTNRSKVWMWGNLPLRAEVTMQFKPPRAHPGQKSRPRNIPPMKMTMVATQLNTAIRPAAAVFRIPSGYTIQDMGDMQKRMRPRQRGARSE